MVEYFPGLILLNWYIDFDDFITKNFAKEKLFRFCLKYLRNEIKIFDPS